jgi:hypothetical protein
MNTNLNLTVFDTCAVEVAYPPTKNAFISWSDATTDPTSDRRENFLHDKKKVVNDFFEWVCMPVHEITPNDVKTWQFELEQRDLAPATIYAMVSRISSFYVWLMKSPNMAGWVASNPVTLALTLISWILYFTFLQWTTSSTLEHSPSHWLQFVQLCWESF